MPVNMTLKNIPDELYLRLKEMAEVEHRSLNGQAIVCLAKVLSPVRTSPEAHLQRAGELRSRLGDVRFSQDSIQKATDEGRE